MKAHIPLPAATRKQIKTEAKKLVKKEWSKQEERALRRDMKLTLYVLYQFFGFGFSRLSKVIIERGTLAKEYDTDEIFWEHIDRLLIDQIGLPLERDYTEDNLCP